MVSEAGMRHRLERQMKLKERDERRAAQEASRKRVRKESDGVPAKWRYPAGLKINGKPIRKGMFYAGSNPCGLSRPDISEPSLVDPTYKIGEFGKPFPELPAFACYQHLSNEQRAAYIEFLASPREEALDIGFVFLYLYGLERRLIVDFNDPNCEFAEGERDAVVDEVVRLFECFASTSPSLHQYIAMLLLYDGSYFDRYANNELLTHRLFLENPRVKSMDKNPNLQAFFMLLIGRFVQHGIELPASVFIDYARATTRMDGALGAIKQEAFYEQYGEDSVKIVEGRLKRMLKVQEVKFPLSGDSKKTGLRTPWVYSPSNLGLRKRAMTLPQPSTFPYPDDLDVPWQILKDMSMTVYLALDNAKNAQANASVSKIEAIPLDVMSSLLGDSIPVSLRDGADAITTVSLGEIEGMLEKAFNARIAYNAKGELTQVVDAMIRKALASKGWTPLLPSVFEGSATDAPSYWKIRPGDEKVFVLRRGLSLFKRAGTLVLKPIYGEDRSEVVKFPEKFAATVDLLYVIGWMFGEAKEAVGEEDELSVLLSAMRATGLRVEHDQQGNLQLRLLVAIFRACREYSLSTRGIKEVAGRCKIAWIQEAVFSYWDKHYKRFLPAGQLEAGEKLYRKLDLDPSQLLLDYHAGDLRRNADGDDVGFFIDQGRLARTIEDTSDVHLLLKDVFADEQLNDGDEAVDSNGGSRASSSPVNNKIILEEEQFEIGKVGVANGGLGESACSADTTKMNAAAGGGVERPCDTKANDKLVALRDFVTELVSGRDELPSKELVDGVKDYGGYATRAEALEAIAALNEATPTKSGDLWLEIDGEDAFVS